MIPRILNLQGMLGVGAALLLSVLLLVKAGEVRHWRKQAAHFERLHLVEQSAAARTVANYRAAAETARSADKANAERVAADQRLISERTTNDFEARLVDARARALRLQLESRTAPAAGGAARAAPVPAARQAAGAARGAAEKDRLSLPADLSLEERLMATEQAIQLDELFKWVNGQAGVATGRAPDRD
ncbi:MAG: hypothetical protein H0V46_01990 [Sphingomonas sp.]|nr:hypothetical protein [Sphingomonas sp.]